MLRGSTCDAVFPPAHATLGLTPGARLEKLAAVPVALRRAGRVDKSVPAARVRGIAQRMLRALALDAAELSVVLCDDAVMRDLNRRYRQRDRSTDVLAFAQHEGRAMPQAALLGDIVISVETAARQARIARKTPLAEIALLLAHGLLHLLGCDHRTENEDRRMRARTDLLLASAALGGRRHAVDKLGAVRPAGPRRGPAPKAGARQKLKRS